MLLSSWFKQRKISKLLKNAGAKDPALDEFLELNPFAVQFRYDSFGLMDDALDRKDLIEKIEAAFARIESQF